jgi:iduronate 2-sulfatase
VYHNGNVSEGHDAKSWSIPYQLADNFDPKFGKPAARLYHNDSLNKLAVMYEKEALEKGIMDNEGIDWHVFKKIMVSSEAADVSDEGYEDGIYAQEAVEKLKFLAQQNQPFFYGIGFSRPHLPFNAPKKYWNLYQREEVPLAEFQNLVPDTPEFIYHSFGELRGYNDIDDSYSLTNKIPIEKQRELVHGYMASVSYVDAQLGKILDAIESNGLSENTIIVVFGDHGYHLGDHAMWNKHSNFEQATRIPLIFAGPKIAKNKKVNHPVELLDVFPTLFDLCGITNPQQNDGISLKNLLDKKKKTTVEKDFAMSQYTRHGNRMGYSIRTERYRLTHWYKNGYNTNKDYNPENLEFVELYDYQIDPLETKNLGNDPKFRSIIILLNQKLINHLNTLHQKIQVE